MACTAHVDTFARDNLPPRDQWPELLFLLPELQYPERMNCATMLLDRAIERGRGDHPAVLSPDGVCWTYRELNARANRTPMRVSFFISLTILSSRIRPSRMLNMNACDEYCRVTSAAQSNERA